MIAYRIAMVVRPWFGWLSVLLLVSGLFLGLAAAPADYQQGDAFRIMYIHVPAAIMAMLTYVVMAMAALVFLVWKIKVCDMIATVSAPLGVLFTMMTLIAGSIWGKPTWGTWWIWDARLTSELILLFIYIGIIAMRSALPDARLASRVVCVLILVGAINLPIIHYSVNWWHTLHQGATILTFSPPSIARSMLYPLLVMICAAVSFYVWLMCVCLQIELLKREQQTRWVYQLVSVEG